MLKAGGVEAPVSGGRISTYSCWNSSVIKICPLSPEWFFEMSVSWKSSEAVKYLVLFVWEKYKFWFSHLFPWAHLETWEFFWGSYFCITQTIGPHALDPLWHFPKQVFPISTSPPTPRTCTTPLRPCPWYPGPWTFLLKWPSIVLFSRSVSRRHPGPLMWKLLGLKDGQMTAVDGVWICNLGVYICVDRGAG